MAKDIIHEYMDLMIIEHDTGEVTFIPKVADCSKYKELLRFKAMDKLKDKYTIKPAKNDKKAEDEFSKDKKK